MYLRFILCFLIITWSNIRAQTPASPQKRLAGLLTQYQRHTLSDTAYLNAVDSLVPLVWNNSGLEQLLSTFQQIAFGDQKLGRYRAQFYRYMMFNSINTNKYG